MAESSYEVQLAIYDLSQGMAKQLSAQFLGQEFAIDIIPHTGVIVYGREFFFGGGIQSDDPQRFRQMMGIYPVKVVSLGRTSVTRAAFEQWCQEATQKGLYTPASYDLLRRNCNNFSHDAAMQGLKLAQGVPEWILDVPRKFLSSPMGQMVRPMLENMQVTGNSPGVGGGGSSGIAPFANAPTSNFTNAVQPPQQQTPPAMANPWANIPSSSKTETPSNSSSTTINDESKKPPADSSKSPLLDSFHKPLISTDSKTVVLCAKKVSDALDDASEKETLQSIAQILSSSTTKPTSDQVEAGCQVVLSVLLQHNSKVTTFALMLLRVIILQSTGKNEPSALQCLEWIQTQLVLMSSSSGGSILKSHAARSMAWTTLSNAASLAWWTNVPEELTEAALVDLSVESQPRPEVRQAVAAFLYNLVLKQNTSSDEEELSDSLVSILCATMESIATEPDATTRLRRLLVGARILVPQKTVHAATKSLMQDLGFQDAVQELAMSTAASGNSNDAQKCQTLAAEFLKHLQD